MQSIIQHLNTRKFCWKRKLSLCGSYVTGFNAAYLWGFPIYHWRLFLIYFNEQNNELQPLHRKKPKIQVTAQLLCQFSFILGLKFMFYSYVPKVVHILFPIVRFWMNENNMHAKQEKLIVSTQSVVLIL